MVRKGEGPGRGETSRRRFWLERGKEGGAEKGKRARPGESAGGEKLEREAAIGPGSGEKSWRLPSWWPVPLLMAAGLCFRLTVTLWTPIIYPDSMQYMHLAREIRTGVFFQRDFDLDEGFIKSRRLPPLYSFVLAPLASAQADLERRGIILSLVLSTLSFIPLYLAASRALSRRAALVSLALLSFNNFASWYSYPLLSEPLFTALFVSVIWISLEALCRPGWGRLILAGILSALLYMTRDVGITAAPLIVLAGVVKFRFLDRESWRRTLIRAGVVALAFLFAAGPYFLHIRVRTGHWGLTVQMDNTSITRQIKSVGGDRWDRDRLSGEQLRWLGDKDDDSFLSLVRIAPQLLFKVLRNMKLYGRELIQRTGLFLFALLLVGVAAMVAEFRRSRKRELLFLRLFLLLWPVQLWFLYCLVTPYMVDERYMYPVAWVYVLLAGFGVEALSLRLLPSGSPEERPEINPSAGGRWGRALISLAPLTAVVFLFLIVPPFIHPQVINFILRAPGEKQSWLFTCPYLGLIPLFAAAFVPLRPRLFGKILSAQPLSPAVAAAAGAFLLPGVLLFIIASPGSALHLVSSLLLGAGLSFLFLLAARAPRVRPGLFLPASALFLGAAFFSQWPDYSDLHERVSPRTVPNKYSAGHKEAALEIKALGLVPPGKTFCSRKPFLAYYLDGKWYLDKEKNESIPQTIPELLEILATGKIDFLETDSFTLKALRPLLTPLAFGLRTLPDGRIIYSRYFPQFNRIITVYDVRHSEPELPDASADGHMARAQAYYREANLPLAYRELEQSLVLDPERDDAWRMKLAILQLYYKLVYRPNMPSMLFFPELLPLLLHTAEVCSQLAPDDAGVKAALEQARKDYTRELNAINQKKKALEEEK